MVGRRLYLQHMCIYSVGATEQFYPAGSSDCGRPAESFINKVLYQVAYPGVNFEQRAPKKGLLLLELCCAFCLWTVSSF